MRKLKLPCRHHAKHRARTAPPTHREWRYSSLAWAGPRKAIPSAIALPDRKGRHRQKNRSSPEQHHIPRGRRMSVPSRRLSCPPSRRLHPLPCRRLAAWFRFEIGLRVQDHLMRARRAGEFRLFLGRNRRDHRSPDVAPSHQEKSHRPRRRREPAPSPPPVKDKYRARRYGPSSPAA